MDKEQEGKPNKASNATEAGEDGQSSMGLWADAVLCYLWLCVLQELPNRLFFPALVEMGFSGLEGLLGVHLLSCFLGIDPLWRMAVRHRWALLLASLPVFFLHGEVESHYKRTVLVAVAVILLSWAVFAALFNNERSAQRMSWSLITAILINICLRFAFKSALPVWSFHHNAVPDWAAQPSWSLEIMQCDKLAGLIGLAAAVALFREKQSVKISSPATATLRWVLPALAFGCLQFLTLWLFAQHSIVPRWVGVDPNTWGIFVIAAMFGGFALGLVPALVHSPLWSCVGAVGASLLYYGQPYPAMVGGLLLGMFCCSSWPLSTSTLNQFADVKGRSLALSQLAFIFGEFITVWNIAYMFLGIGDTFREAPHYPLLFSVAVVGLNNMLTRPSRGETVKRGKPTNRRRAMMLLAALLLAVMGPSVWIRQHYAVTHPQHVQSEPEQVKVMIWNVHTGYADNGYDNYLLAARFLQDMETGVVALLENDQTRLCTGNRDMVEFLMLSLGFKYHSYGVPTRESTWGCSFISLYPIKASNITVLPSPYGTRSCLIDAIVDVDGHDFNVVVSHFSTEEFPEDLKLQTERLAELAVQKQTTPLSVLCYITNAPDSATWYRPDQRANYHTLVTKGTLQDPDPTDHDRWCQYIFSKNTVVHKYYHVDTGYMSDTEAQLAVISTVPNQKATNENNRAQTVVAQFYKYNILERSLQYLYTGAKRSWERRRILAAAANH